MAVAEMKLRFAIFIILFVSVLIFSNTNVAQAGWNAINSGYAVTTNYHGLDVPLGEEVVATAGTTDHDVTQVEFKWLNPDEEEIHSETHELSWSSTPPANVPQKVIDWAQNNPGVEVGYAQSTLESDSVDVIGWFTVKAIFHGPTGPKGQDHDRFKATSFFYIDEVPFGPIVILLISFGFLGLYAIKRKRYVPIDTHT